MNFWLESLDLTKDKEKIHLKPAILCAIKNTISSRINDGAIALPTAWQEMFNYLLDIKAVGNVNWEFPS